MLSSHDFVYLTGENNFQVKQNCHETTDGSEQRTCGIILNFEF